MRRVCWIALIPIMTTTEHTTLEELSVTLAPPHLLQPHLQVQMQPQFQLQLK